MRRLDVTQAPVKDYQLKLIWKTGKKYNNNNNNNNNNNKQLVYAQFGIRLGEWDRLNSLRFWDTNGSPNPVQTIRSSDSHKKRKKEKKREPAE